MVFLNKYNKGEFKIVENECDGVIFKIMEFRQVKEEREDVTKVLDGKR